MSRDSSLNGLNVAPGNENQKSPEAVIPETNMASHHDSNHLNCIAKAANAAVAIANPAKLSHCCLARLTARIFANKSTMLGIT